MYYTYQLLQYHTLNNCTWKSRPVKWKLKPEMVAGVILICCCAAAAWCVLLTHCVESLNEFGVYV